MAELLIEIGCEEIPASYVEKGVQQLLDLILVQLKEYSLSISSFQTFCTPRRLIVQIEGIELTQPDSIERQRGPGLKVAYNAAGQPTPALLGFCKSQQINIEEVTKEDDYIWCTRTLKGKNTLSLLSEILPRVLSKMQFPKNMRWADGKNRFARPIRWILASFDHQAISFSFENIQSGLESRGHRFKSQGTFKATCLDELIVELRKRFVEPEPKKRMSKIQGLISKMTSSTSLISEDLLYENAFLTEWPDCLECTFDSAFLELPKEVLVTTMVKHLRFFPIYNEKGELTNRSISVMNNGDLETVKSGNEWILNARFNDARFFYQEDQQHSLDKFLEKTQNIIYQDKLGTIRQKAERLEKLCHFIAEKEKIQDLALAGIAGLYAKSDLSTGLVNELPELQGIIAGIYAEREIFDKDVCQALKDQYNLATILKEKNSLSICLFIADQIDKLVGYLSLGILPKGSSDPFALRKAVTNLVLINSCRKDRLSSLLPLFEKSREIYHSQGFSFDESYQKPLEEIFTGRYKALAYEENEHWNWKEGIEHSHLHLFDAVISDCDHEIRFSPENILFKLNVLSKTKFNESFIQAATRCINLYRFAVEKDYNMDQEISHLESPEGELLLQKIVETEPLIKKYWTEGKINSFIETIIILNQYIHNFFEENMIIVDDIKLRESRLGLIQRLYKLLLYGGDFSKIYTN